MRLSNKENTLFQLCNPHLRVIRFQGRWAVNKEKITLPEARAGVTELTNVAVTSMTSLRNINLIFPSSIAGRSPFARSFTNILGPSHPWPIAVLMETFSTSAFKVLIWIIATTTKICTGRLSTQAHAQSFNKTPTPSPTHCSQTFAAMFKYRSHAGEPSKFSGLIHSAGELLHTP